MASVMIDVQFSRFVGPVSLAYSPAVTNQEPAPVLIFPFFFSFLCGWRQALLTAHTIRDGDRVCYCKLDATNEERNNSSQQHSLSSPSHVIFNNAANTSAVLERCHQSSPAANDAQLHTSSFSQCHCGQRDIAVCNCTALNYMM